jgi:hypothetical protein
LFHVVGQFGLGRLGYIDHPTSPYIPPEWVLGLDAYRVIAATAGVNPRWMGSGGFTFLKRWGGRKGYEKKLSELQCGTIRRSRYRKNACCLR